jgi:hippurate hydrolase
VTYNDPQLADRLREPLRAALGGDNVLDGHAAMASEDFGRFGLEGHQIPAVLLWLGAADPDQLRQSQRAGKPLPSLHSSLFAPLPEPAIRTGVIAMTAAVIGLMSK